MKKRLIYTAITAIALLAFNEQMQNQPRPKSDVRFTKMAKTGESLKPWQGPWHCVFDSQLGLFWEVKQEDESIHQADWTYSWFDGRKGQANSGDCYFKKERCDTQDLIQATNQEQLCGQAAWRLPTSMELNALYRPQDRAHRPLLSEDYFPRLKDGDYWTADADVSLTGFYKRLGKGAFAFNPYDWQLRELPYRNAAFVILVADAKTPTTSMQTRFTPANSVSLEPSEIESKALALSTKN
ncbi:Lcl domain-containing protein [Pseudoalteromonas xiamenensis]